jgi:hypothetical protein
MLAPLDCLTNEAILVILLIEMLILMFSGLNRVLDRIPPLLKGLDGLPHVGPEILVLVEHERVRGDDDLRHTKVRTSL